MSEVRWTSMRLSTLIPALLLSSTALATPAQLSVPLGSASTQGSTPTQEQSVAQTDQGSSPTETVATANPTVQDAGQQPPATSPGPQDPSQQTGSPSPQEAGQPAATQQGASQQTGGGLLGDVLGGNGAEATPTGTGILLPQCQDYRNVPDCMFQC